MDAFAFMLKTNSGDLPYVRRLLESFRKYNIEGIPLYIVFDKNEHDLIIHELGKCDNVSYIDKEDIDTEYTEESVRGISADYINQAIVKLSFWKLGLCKNYSCIDPELEFIRPFTVDEFMYDEETPYSVLIEDNDLHINPTYYDSYYIYIQEKLDVIKEMLSITDRHTLTCNSMQTLNSKVLRHMEENFMNPQGYSYLNLLKLSPYEFSWYNYYLQKTSVIPIHPCEPHYKIYRMPYQKVVDAVQGISRESLQRAYLGEAFFYAYDKKKIEILKSFNSNDFFTIETKILDTVGHIAKKNRYNLLKHNIRMVFIKCKRLFLKK